MTSPLPLSEAVTSERTLAAMDDDIQPYNGPSDDISVAYNNLDISNQNALRIREERRLQRQVLQMMGRPYLVRSNILWTFPLTILLGALVGTGSFLLLYSSSYIRQHASSTFGSHHHQYQGIGQVLLLIVRYCLGGLLAGVCLYGISSSSPKSIRHFYHDLVDLQLDPSCSYSIRQALLVVVATYTLRCVGAPLGPEMMVTALASLLVTISRTKCFSTRLYRRTVASWMQACVAGSLACVMPSWLGSLVAVFELVASARPHDMTLDAVLQRRSTVSYTHLRAHETREDLVCRLLLEKKRHCCRVDRYLLYLHYVRTYCTY